MSLASMTGFARADGATDALAWTWELRSVNGKSLDLRLRLPPGLDTVEQQCRALAQSRIARGTIHASLAVARTGATSEVRINEPVLAAVIEAARLVAARIDAQKPTLDGLLAMKGVIEIVEAEESEEARTRTAAMLVEGFARALDALVAARAGEGAATGAMLAARVDEIARLTRLAETSPVRTPDAIRARLAEQVKALVAGGNGLDPDRLHQEAVLLATKADIREEIDRLAAHVAAARKLLAEGGPVGRKLDFLAQEFSREANTLCAKSNDVGLTATGLDLKHAVDQFREQVQNLE